MTYRASRARRANRRASDRRIERCSESMWRDDLINPCKVCPACKTDRPDAGWLVQVFGEREIGRHDWARMQTKEQGDGEEFFLTLVARVASIAAGNLKVDSTLGSMTKEQRQELYRIAGESPELCGDPEDV